MNILSLNCRGCGRPETVQEICSLIRLHHPSLVFLSETRLSDKRAQDLKFRFGFSNAFGVKSEGLSGGLVLLWNNDSAVSLNSYSQSHIDVFVQNNLLGEREWRFTGFYGQLVRSRRKLSWDLMKFLRKEYDIPWLIAGDFNEILDASEQFGGNVREEWKMDGSRDAVEICKLCDLGYSGLPFTWDNRQQGRDNIKVRLDRAMVDETFMELFDNTGVQHIQTTESDHCALSIVIKQSEWIDSNAMERPFRFENAWTRHETYDRTVEESWLDGASDMASVHGALGGVRNKLKKWSMDEFGSVKRQLKIMRQRLEKLCANTLYTGPTGEERKLMRRISELLSREEMMSK